MMLRSVGQEQNTCYKLTNTSLTECGPARGVMCRSVSWNATGTTLAMGCADRVARLWTVSADGNHAREVLVVSGHAGPVVRVRFHPAEPCVLATAAFDGTVRLWDVRNATQRASGRIDIRAGSNAIETVDWCCSKNNNTTAAGSQLFAVTEKDGSVHVYDTRKLSTTTAAATSSSSLGTGGRGANKTIPLKSYGWKDTQIDTCIFSPHENYLLAGITRKQPKDGLGESKIAVLKLQEDDKENNYHGRSKDDGGGTCTSGGLLWASSFPAHVGPIYSMQLSPDRRSMATGGSDAVVGIWDMETMTCTHTVTRRAKFIRCVAFSHDNKFLATASEEDGVDLADASTGAAVGVVPAAASSGGGGGGRRGISSSAAACGAEEVSWHPKEHVLACARMDVMAPQVAPVVVAKLTISASQ